MNTLEKADICEIEQEIFRTQTEKNNLERPTFITRIKRKTIKPKLIAEIARPVNVIGLYTAVGNNFRIEFFLFTNIIQRKIYYL